MQKIKKKDSIGIRLNPDIDAKTHKKISTGKAEDKFGLSKKNLISFLKKYKKIEKFKTQCNKCSYWKSNIK